ncbi:hypothetical protein BH10ACI3_BH10ACI3_19280 [soil metagenome]
MTYSPLAIKRRQVLGDLYALCDNVEMVPVHLDNAEGEKIGHVDESLGHYADAYLFHLPEDVCKKLSTGHYIYSFDYDYSDPDSTGRHRRIKLNYIFLTGRKVPDAVSRSSKKALAALQELGAEAVTETA